MQPSKGLGPILTALGVLLTVAGVVAVLAGPLMAIEAQWEIEHAAERLVRAGAAVAVVGGFLLGCGVYSLTSRRA